MESKGTRALIWMHEHRFAIRTDMSALQQKVINISLNDKIIRESNDQSVLVGRV